MPTRLLSDPELDQLTSWPSEVAHSDLVEFFTLDLGDLRWLRTHAGAMNRLGLAIQLCALRYLGFIPGSLALLRRSCSPWWPRPWELHRAR